MKRFINCSLLFLCPLIATVILGVPAAIYEWVVFEKSLRVPNKKVAVVGDSHLQYAINDNHIKYVENFAHRASQPNFWRAIARMVYERNPQIKHVVIGINPNVVLANKGTNERLAFSRGHTPAIILLDIMRRDDMGDSFQTERIFQRTWGGCIFPAIKRMLKLDENITLHEGWFCVERNADPEGTSWPKERNNDGVTNGGVSWGCFEVESLIELAEQYGVTPILVTAPIPNRYLSAYTQEQRDYVVKNVGEIARRHNCRWLNYAKSFHDLDCFCDEFHLNAKGAAQFSQMLDKDLRMFYPGIDL